MIAAAAAAVSCTGSFLDRNTNPDQAYDEQMAHDGLAVGGPFSKMLMNALPVYQMDGTSEYGSDRYQIIQDLSANGYCGYFAATNSGFRANNLYNITYSGWYEAQFNDTFVRFTPQWLTINQFREGNETLCALADVFKVYGLQRITDTYGPIPYSSLLEAGIQKPYDSQEKVYQQMFKEIDAAIDILTDFAMASPSARLLSEYDNVFGGDVVKWVKFANTVRMRMAMRVVYVDQALAMAEAEKSVTNPIGMPSTVADKASYTPAAGQAWQNMNYTIQYDYPGGDSHIGATIETYMNSWNDPRREKYFTKSEHEGREYFGVRLGVTNGDSYKNDKASRINVSKGDPIMLMAPAEALFLQAEYYLRLGDDATAKTLYEDGVRLAFATTGVSGVEDYLETTDGVSGYNDVVSAGNSYNTPLTEVSVSWDSASNTENHLEQIITQKYLAMFPEGQEAWSEFRRTGYPKVIPVKTNNSGGLINTDIQVRRLPFPSQEYRTNAANVAEAVTLLGGADNGGTKLWWDKK